MRLLVLSGFLGSGKTTLLMEVIRQLTRDPDLTVAVIENEVGAVGVDTSLIAGTNHLPVRDIVSGCICCSLRVDLVQTLLALERDHDPDVVLLEPSGVASPAHVLTALEGYSGEIEGKHTLAIVDASRFHRITDLSIPLVRDGLNVASQVLITKADLVSPDQLADVRDRITRARTDVPVISVDATDATARAHAVAEILRTTVVGTPRSQSRSPAEATAPTGADGVSASVSSLTHEVTWPSGLPESTINRALTRLVTDISGSAEAHGAQLIGHIKAVLKTAGGGYLFASVTAFGQEPTSKGRLPRREAEGTLTVNAIVYGIAQDQLTAATRDAGSRLAESLARGC